MEDRSKSVLGIGNILLDISALVDDDYVTKWDLKLNDAVLAEEKHQGLAKELQTLSAVKYIPGGSAQNTMRVCQWVLGKYPQSCTIIGCIGDDEFGKIIKSKAKKDNLNCKYLIVSGIPTGNCSVLTIKSGDRTMVADRGAANHFKKSFLTDHWYLVEKSRICYSTGFFLSTNAESVLEVAKFCSKSKDKLFAFNLSAPFVIGKHFKEIEKTILYADLIFGSDSEAQIYSDLKNWKTQDRIKIIKLMAAESKTNENKRKVLVIMEGLNSLLIAFALAKNEQLEQKERIKTFRIEMPKIKKEEVDLNGIGDAITGGFLGKLTLNDLDLSEKSIRECIQMGIHTGNEIIRQDGVQIPDYECNCERNFLN